jgi:hypothetical protein
MKPINSTNKNQKEPIQMTIPNDKQPDKDQPKKKKAPVKKKKATNKKDSLDKEYMDYVEKIMRESLQEALLEESALRKVDNQALISIIEEYMGAFILMGYDVDNEPVVILNAKNQLQADGLATLLNRIFMSNNNHNKGGSEPF